MASRRCSVVGRPWNPRQRDILVQNQSKVTVLGFSVDYIEVFPRSGDPLDEYIIRISLESGGNESKALKAIRDYTKTVPKNVMLLDPSEAS